MHPQDIVVLLKIIGLRHNNWKNSDLAYPLQISASEITEVLNRYQIRGSVDSKKRKGHINSFKEFLIYWFKYVFPAEPGTVVRGISTAHSAYPINEHMASDNNVYVLPYTKGTQRSQAIGPLYKALSAVVQDDNLFYELLSITDIIRTRRTREMKTVIEQLEKRL